MEVTMKRRVSLDVDQFEARATPSDGTFLPPGVTQFVAESNTAPPPVQVSQDGSVVFLPPGVTQFVAESNVAPPPVQVSRDGSIVFMPPGAAQFIAGSNS
jgi:hypothetical protein